MELDTGSQIVPGDFDFVADAEQEFRSAMLAVGFLPEDRSGRLRGGFYHPDLLIGVELVGGSHFDGVGDRRRIRVIEMASGEVFAAPTEDLIADRAGQWAANRQEKSMLNQALVLLRLAEGLDFDSLDRRIRQDTCGELDLAALRSMAP